MPINADKTQLWKADVEQSIDYYNSWFLKFAPETYRAQREMRTHDVLDAFAKTDNLSRIDHAVLIEHPQLLSIFRMLTAPPLARDRLMGLSYVSKNLIESMEGKEDKPPRIPARMARGELEASLRRICDVIREVADTDLLPWLGNSQFPAKSEVKRAATVIADRLCGAASDPIIRNAQEKRQLAALQKWLKKHGYRHVETDQARDPHQMPPGTFTFRLNLPTASTNIPIDCVIQPLSANLGEMPVLIEAKSAGDATNTNKRRKEEAHKFSQLKTRYGADTSFLLLLCGYFEPGYLGYEAAEGIDWIWEHRLDDLAGLLLPPPSSTRELHDESDAYLGHIPDPTETTRFAGQVRVDRSKSAAERNRLGQFSTPYPLARKMVRRCFSHLEANQSICFLEPALGSGVFFSALDKECEGRLVREAVGIELDAEYAEIARTLWPVEPMEVRHGDFLAFAADPANRERFNLLCTNPPYVRHHHLNSDLKLELQARVKKNLGLEISGLSGLYVYFLLLADQLLAPGAVASWLLPSEFFFVNYGRPLREYLTRHVTLLDVHQFDPEDVQFDDALVTSCIVTYRKSRPVATDQFIFQFGGDVLVPKRTVTFNAFEQTAKPKWTFAQPVDSGAEFSDAAVIRLGDLFHVRRGVATGANDFFTMDLETAEQYAIPTRFLKPILPSPRYLKVDVVEADATGEPLLDGVNYLLDCQLPPERVQAEFPGLWNYLQTGVTKGIPDGYLCASRDFWYYQEQREPSPFLVSYMGRGNAAGKSPIRFILNYSRAIVTNVYLNLYPTHALKKLLNEDASRFAELHAILNAITPANLARNGRVYGGGLHKVEPKEIAGVPLVNLPTWMTVALSPQPLLLVG